MLHRFVVIIIMTLLTNPVYAASFYTQRLDDPKAVYLTSDILPVHGDGIGDDSDVLQAAINKVQETTRRGIVFIPAGRYRLTKTIYVWSGIRLIGYGATRPVFVLGASTPGFQDGDGKYMVHFVSDRPADGQPIRDANPGTFYSAMSNIDIEIMDGNPAAIGVRFFIAQHCYLAHMDFHIGSGKAGIEQIGNEAEDLHFYGGDYGIITTKPSPSWPFLLIDSSFDGQRVASIQSEEGGLTLVRDEFKNAPTAISINPDRAEELWSKDCRFEDISGPAVIFSYENNPRTEINLEDAVCERVPILAQSRESGKQIAGPGPIYTVKQLTHGLHIDDIGSTPEIRTTFNYTVLPEAPAPVPSDIPALPPCESWVNIKTLGAAGDGVTDDTDAFKKAIAGNKAIYLPTGRYLVSDTLVLGADTVLIGVSPIMSQIQIKDSTPAFQGPGGPKAVIEAPSGGTDIITGIGIDTGGINPRAVGLKWMAGPNSLVNDVRFLGGHGTYDLTGNWVPPYNNNRTGDPDVRRRWDSEYPSLWITNGGGGTFKDIWTPNTFAQAGVSISDTSTEGRMYAISSEHHVTNEIKLRNVSNWRIYDFQSEEEYGEGPHCLPWSLVNCSNITVANVYLYRVFNTTIPFPNAVKIQDCRDIRFRNMHLYGPSKLNFDATLLDQTHDRRIMDREVAALNISGPAPKPAPARSGPELEPGAVVEKVVGGFNNIDGAAVDPNGNVYFVDSHWNDIYRWSPDAGELTLVRDNPIIQPAGLAFDRTGNLLVISSSGVVYSFLPDSPDDQLTVLPAVPAVARPGLVSIQPTNRWRDAHDFIDAATKTYPNQYVSPDGSTFIPASDDFLAFGQVDASGRRRWPSGTLDLLRAYGFAPATPGKPFYLADEFNQKTYVFSVNPDGSLADPKLFAEQGETGTAVDDHGNVYIAAGLIYVYDAAGKLIDTIDVPERPSCLVFGGKDRRTLYFASRSALYSVRTRYKGE